LNFFPTESPSRKRILDSQTNGTSIGERTYTLTRLASSKILKPKKASKVPEQQPVAVLPLRPGHNKVFASYEKSKKYSVISRTNKAVKAAKASSPSDEELDIKLNSSDVAI